MAEFCTACSKEMGFPEADINEKEIFDSLQKNQYTSVICEGCGMLAVARSEDDRMLFAYPSDEDEEMVIWTSTHRKIQIEESNTIQMKKCLYLDDIRIPQNIPLDHEPWTIVRSYNDFVAYIKENGLPSLISFDHDLADEHYRLEFEEWSYTPERMDMGERTGYDCAKWLVEYCMDNNLKMCQFTVHSANPAGAQNILGLLNNFRKNCDQEPNGYRTFW